MADWKRIGCAVDFSDGSHAALREASELARRFEAELVLLHAEEMPGVTEIPPPQSVVESTRRDLEAMLAKWEGRGGPGARAPGRGGRCFPVPPRPPWPAQRPTAGSTCS